MPQLDLVLWYITNLDFFQYFGLGLKVFLYALCILFFAHMGTVLQRRRRLIRLLNYLKSQKKTLKDFVLEMQIQRFLEIHRAAKKYNNLKQEEVDKLLKQFKAKLKLTQQNTKSPVFKKEIQKILDELENEKKN